MGQTAEHERSSPGERRRAAILEAAAAVFLERGYSGATLEDVIARSGGSRATLYEQFGDKAGLFAAIVEGLCEKMLEPLSPARAAGRTPDENLRRLARAFMAVLMARRNVALYRLVIAEARRFPELGRRVFSAGPEAAVRRVRDYLGAERQRGFLAITDPDAAARIFLEMIKGDLHTRALFGLGRAPSRASVAKQVDIAVALFLDGVRRRPD